MDLEQPLRCKLTSTLLPSLLQLFHFCLKQALGWTLEEHRKQGILFSVFSPLVSNRIGRVLTTNIYTALYHSIKSNLFHCMSSHDHFIFPWNMCNKSDANKLRNRKVASFYSKLMTALNLISCFSYPGLCAGTAKFFGIHSSLEKSIEH